MQGNSNWTTYEDRLSRVTAYVYDHLDEPLDLNRLADIACLSPCHWHRIYHATHGETIAATVKRLRLHRAAGYLAQTSMAIDEIGRKAGYTSLQSFTRAFAAAYGLPPAQYRRNGDHARFRTRGQATASAGYGVTIRDIPAATVVAVEHSGSYMQIGRAFDALYGWLGARDLLTPGLRSIGIYLDDPTAVAEAALRSMAGVVLDAPMSVAAPLTVARIAGGPYAILRHVGPYASMRAAYEWLYGDWLVKSGREAADEPVVEEYLNSPRDTAPAELATDICLPLRAT